MPGNASSRMLADPQFGLVAVLRPFSGYSAVYEGQAGSVPIMFTEKGKTLDDMAGEAGYAPNLLAGLPVPMGSRICLWFPMAGPGVLFGPYNWVLIWRIRNTHDYRTQRSPYHYPRQGNGAPSTEAAPLAGPRVVIPCAVQSVVFTSPGPRTEAETSSPNQWTVTDFAIHELCVEAIQPKQSLYQFRQPVMNPGGVIGLPNPLIPTNLISGVTVGVMEQGVVDPNTAAFGERGMPMFLPFETYCLGDELLLACVKDQIPRSDRSALSGTPWSATWQFQAADSMFRILFNDTITVLTPWVAPDVGVYVTCGVVP